MLLYVSDNISDETLINAVKQLSSILGNAAKLLNTTSKEAIVNTMSTMISSFLVRDFGEDDTPADNNVTLTNSYSNSSSNVLNFFRKIIEFFKKIISTLKALFSSVKLG